MNINVFYIVFSVIIVACALLSPAFVAWVNNHHHLELHKLDMQESKDCRSRDVIDGYFRSAGACIASGSSGDYADFGHYCSLVYFYLPDELHLDIADINRKITNYNRDPNLMWELFQLATKAREYRQS